MTVKSADLKSNYWCDSAAAPAAAADTIEAGHRVDVVVAGAGFTGLWSAYHLVEQQPALSVVIVEREQVGFGASGRNGGFISPKLGSFHQMLAPGAELGAAAYNAGIAALREISEVIRAEGIDCDLRQTGLLNVATNEVQLRRIVREAEAAGQMELASVRTLDREQLTSHVHSPHFLAGIHEDHCALVHPLKLARGLADLLRRRGVRIVEGCQLTAYRSTGPDVRVSTTRGDLIAGNLVLALNAWAPEYREFRRDLVPVRNYVVATEPLGADILASLWPSGIGVSDKRFFTQYLRPTADGRIVIGGKDAPGSFGSKVLPDREHNEAGLEALRESIRWMFPELAKIRFTHGWGGTLAVTPAFVPRVGVLGSRRIHFGHGYNGQGLCASFSVGRMISSDVLGVPLPWPRPYYATHAQGRFPIEPFRSVGASLIRREMLSKDRRADLGISLRNSAEPLLLRAGIRLYGRASGLAPTTQSAQLAASEPAAKGVDSP